MSNLFPWQVTGQPIGRRKYTLVFKVVLLNSACLAIYLLVILTLLKLFQVI